MNGKLISSLLVTLFFLSLVPHNNFDIEFVNNDNGWASSASKNWKHSSPLITEETTFSVSKNIIPSPYGDFDPLSEPSPVPFFEFPYDTKLAIVQLSSNNGSHIVGLSEEFKFKPLNRISTNTWIVKMEGTPELIKGMKSHSKVRWLENFSPGWKLHPQLNNWFQDDMIPVLVVLSMDLKSEEKEELFLELVNEKYEVISCGYTDCIINLDTSREFEIERLLADDRIIWIEPSYSSILTNAQAADQSGVTSTIDNWNSGLDGSGEVVSVVDTGLDIDHSDYASQVIAVQNSFGLDNDGSDSISGHGTHVVGTILGDGSGEAEAKGIAPEATLQMYQLEHNQQGVIARIGSIYDVMDDAYNKQARFQSTSWVSENAGGKYNGDSQSADRFLWDNRDFTAIYSAGNNGSNGMNTVAAPSTSKNAISVGASTDSSEPTVALFSGQGPTDDGRIKPDLVAPGENICSSRAEEASNSMGTDCSTAFHSDGSTSLHTSLSGASQATPVVTGAAVLTRQYLREELGLSSPSSDLIKAILVHGAEDLGVRNVPNELEGWGKLNLENSLYPMYSGTELSTWYDQSQTLEPGRMFVYAYDLDISKGLEVTLAWNDEDISASSFQNSSKLLNNLDLIVIAPNGTTYLGNDFLNGISVTTNISDDVNNVERIRILPSTPTNGVWQIQVHHRGGTSQPFSLVVTGFGEEDSSSDLSTIPDSLWISESTPMVNSVVLVRGSWANQANLGTSSYDVSITDLTTGDVIISETRPPLSSGQLDSIQFPHKFTTTGVHELQLIVDLNNEINELNENNNVFNLSFIVAAEGILLEMISNEGNVDNSREYFLNPLNQTSIDLNFRLNHKGTDEQTVQFSVLSIRAVDTVNPDYTTATSDDWDYGINLSDTIITMPPDGENGATIEFKLTLENLDADLSGASKFYASAETIVIEVVSSYVNNPLVTDSLKFNVIINPIADVEVVLAGTGLETGVPGEWVKFSHGIKNIGNSPAVFQMNCTSESNWEIRVGRDSLSNVYQLEQMSQGQQLITDVMIRVPKVISGSPYLGEIEQLNCFVTDLDGTIEGKTIIMNVSVGALESYVTILKDSDGNQILPSFSNPSIIVKPSEMLNLYLEIENIGNVQLDLELIVDGTEPDWSTRAYFFDNGILISEGFSVDVASTMTVIVEIIVPNNAEIGDYNDIEIKVQTSPFSYTLNTTRLILDELPNLEIVDFTEDCVGVSGKDTVCTITIQNSGNVDLILEWPTSSSFKDADTKIITPEGWSAFLSNTPNVVRPSEKKIINIYLQTEPEVAVNSEEKIIIMAISELPSGNLYYTNLEINATVKASSIISIELVNSEGNSLPSANLLEISPGSEIDLFIKASNKGNYDAKLEIDFSPKDSAFVIECLDSNRIILADSYETFNCKIKAPTDGGSVVEFNLISELTTTAEDSITDINSFQLRVTSPEGEQKNQPFLGLSKNYQIGVIISIIILLVVIFFKSKKFDDNSNRIDDVSIVNSSEQRLEIMMKAEEFDSGLISGGVDKSEIEAALNQSKPKLPSLNNVQRSQSQLISQTPNSPQLPSTIVAPPPIPSEGIPPGWTMEQWIHYGHNWLKENPKR